MTARADNAEHLPSKHDGARNVGEEEQRERRPVVISRWIDASDGPSQQASHVFQR
jgi:hypothetical protein